MKHLAIQIGIALAAVWISNNVEAVRNIVGPK